MASLKEATRRGTRHPLWSKEVFREEVEAGAGTIREVCTKWSTDPLKIQGLMNDVARWRKEDPGLDALCRESLKHVALTVGAGRPTLETEDPDWRLKFCEEYLKTKSRVRAAEITPYAYDSILRKMDPERTEYDKVFTDMVLQTEARLLDRAEQLVYESMELEPSHRNKAWIALQLLRVRDRKRYGDKLEVSVGGSIKHSLDGSRLLSQLAEAQEKFLDRARLQIGSGELVEVEVLPSEAEDQEVPEVREDS